MKRWKTKRLPEKIRQSILKRDSYLCQVCGKGRPGRRLHVHHLVGHRVRGADRLVNLVTLCASCHRLVTELSGNSKNLTENPQLLALAVRLAQKHINAFATSR